MRILIIGANGQIGKQLVEKLQQSHSHTPIAMVRKTEQLAQFKERNIDTVLGNLEGSIQELQQTIEASQAEAIVFTAGSGGHTGADKTILIDLDGAVKSMEAAKLAGVQRFVMVSAIGVHKWHTDAKLPSELSYYSAAKYYADHWLQKSDLDYTIIRPGRLTNDSGNGKIKLGETLAHKEIPREDVASLILAVLENEATINQSFDAVGGTVPIVEAVESLAKN
ncbi:SDR family oxidoreductase [Enterococcus olivae]